MQAQIDLTAVEWLLVQDNCNNFHHRNSYDHCSMCLIVFELYDGAIMDSPNNHLDFVQEHPYRLVCCFAIYEPHYETVSVYAAIIEYLFFFLYISSITFHRYNTFSAALLHKLICLLSKLDN